MNCKNCNEVLENDAHFCDNCGAKVIDQRITFRFLVSEIFAAAGLDSLFFNTFKKLAIAPHEVISEYLNGVRKRYINPFAFLAVGVAASLLVFNSFSEEFQAMQTLNDDAEIEAQREFIKKDLSKDKTLTAEELKAQSEKQKKIANQLKSGDFVIGFMLRYWNFIMFLFIPIYALVSKWTYPKHHNYGEHIVINSYLSGFTAIISIIAFLLGLLIHPSIYMLSTFVFIGYYLFTFTKLYNHNFKQAFLKLLRFFVMLTIVLLLVFIVLGILTAAFMMIVKFVNPDALSKFKITFGK